ncbi:MAG TPA: hypothetical protein VGU20_20190 [Stellaceae bacterium]|nr:hypothetical protein [Stellaceae bacterium]
MKRWSDLQIACFLFVELWVTYCFIGPGWLCLHNPNVITRMGLVFSMLDNHSLSLGDFAALTTDKALVNGAYFADKAPGLSFMALPVTAVLKWLTNAFGFSTDPIVDGALSPFFWLSTTVACALTTALFTALSASMLFLAARTALHASRGAAIFGALVYGLATPMAGWATVFFGHAVAGACLITALSLILMIETNAPLWRDRAMGGLIGLLLGWAMVVELASAPAAAIVAFFALTRLRDVERPRRLQLFVGAALGGLIAALPFALYNHLAFGSFFHLGYQNVVGFEGMKSGFLGVSAPNGSVLWEIIFGRYRGVLWISPILALVPVSYWIAAHRLPLSVTSVLLTVPLCYFLINSGYYYWDGGASTGPRHITPSLGFLALTFVPLWDHLPSKIARFPVVILGVGSAVVVLVCALVMMDGPERIADPLSEVIFPLFLLGCVHDIAVSAAMTCSKEGGLHNNLPTLLWLPLLWVGSAVTLTTLFTKAPQASAQTSVANRFL